MVLGGVGWDRKESPKSSLHVCGKDDTKIAIYNLEECTERSDWNSLYNFYLEENRMKQIT